MRVSLFILFFDSKIEQLRRNTAAADELESEIVKVDLEVGIIIN